MDLINNLLAQLGGNVDIENMAAKIGLSPDQVSSAVQALGIAHPQPGDTAETAAASTGLPLDKIQEIIGHIGGEGALAQFASLLGGAAQGGEGGGLGGLLGNLGGLGGLASSLLGGGSKSA